MFDDMFETLDKVGKTGKMQPPTSKIASNLHD